jgi:hypothetical protein
MTRLSLHSFRSKCRFSISRLGCIDDLHRRLNTMSCRWLQGVALVPSAAIERHTDDDEQH